MRRKVDPVGASMRRGFNAGIGERRIDKRTGRNTSLAGHKRRLPEERRSASDAKRSLLFIPDPMLRELTLFRDNLRVWKVSLPSECRTGAALAIIAVADTIECWVAHDLN